MKGSHASQWAAREFEFEAANGELHFESWADFKDEFHKEFMLLNEEVNVVNVLETAAYHQGCNLVDNYLDRFCDLIHDFGYTDPKTIMVKFRQGLDHCISNALASMTSGRLSDTDPKAWFCLAVQMDQNHMADEAFYMPQWSVQPP
jgi:hypothetical protein